MSNLRDVAPELEQKLTRISSELEQGSLRDASKYLSDTPRKVISMEKEASNFYRLNDEWLSTLEEVRRLDGFQDFLRQSRLSMLQEAAANGPVVILNTSKSGSDTLIVTLSGVQHIPLQELSFVDVNVLVRLTQNATAASGRNTHLPDTHRAQIEGRFLQTAVSHQDESPHQEVFHRPLRSHTR